MDDTNVVPFTIQEEGQVTGTLWFGKFKAKKFLSLRDQLQRDKIRRELVGADGAHALGSAVNISFVLAELAVRLAETPDWWKEQGGGLEMVDENIVDAVYKAALKVETDALEARNLKVKAAKGEVEKHQAAKDEK